MRINIVGAGSIGLLLAGKLAMAGIDVTVTTRTAAQRNAIRRDGITVSGLTEGTAAHIQAVAADDESAQDRYDWIFVAVKQTQLDLGWLKEAVRRWGERPRLLLLQNGIGHVDKLVSLVARERIYVAVTTEGARRQSDTSVEHTGSGETWIGPAQISGDEPTSVTDIHLENITNEALSRAGFRVSVSNDIWSKVWEKLLINAVINPLTAVLRLRNGELPNSPERLRLMRRVHEEAAELAARAGMTVAPDLWQRTLDVCRRTALNHSSMLQDVLAGRRTEIDAITGSLVRLADEYGLPLPVNRTLYDLVKGLESST